MRILIALALLAGIAATGCATYEAGRLYSEGSAAISSDPERAVVQLERAAQLAPQASEIHNHLGLAYAEAGRSQDAIAAFERALAIDCDNEAAQYNLARARGEGR